MQPQYQIQDTLRVSIIRRLILYLGSNCWVMNSEKHIASEYKAHIQLQIQHTTIHWDEQTGNIRSYNNIG